MRARRVAPALLFALACGEMAGPGDGVPARVEVAGGNGQRAEVATPLPSPIVARVVDGSGAPIAGVAVRFDVVTGGGEITREARTTDADGRIRAVWTLGTTAGEQLVEARLEGPAQPTPGVFRATATAATPATAVKAQGDGQTRAAGVALRDSLAVRILDEYGNGVPGQRVVWTIGGGGGRVSPVTSMTDEQGRARTQLTLGTAPGPNVVIATPGALEPLHFTANGVAPPALAAVSPAVLVPGGSIQFTGTGFADGRIDSAVMLGGIPAEVIEATPTRVVARVPCVPSGTWPLLLNTHGVRLERSAEAAIDVPIVIEPGAATRVGGSLPGCGEIAASGTYLVSATRPEPASGPAEVRIRGAAGAALPPVGSVATATMADPGTAAATRTPGGATLHAALPGLRDMAAHQRVLEGSRRIARTRALDASASVAYQTIPSPREGDTLTLKLPDVLGDPCDVRSLAQARVVFAGTRILVLEDINAPLAGQADSVMRQLGLTTELIALPLLEEHFGEMLAQPGEHGGLLHILLTPVVNLAPGVSGYTSISDFLDPRGCGSSNEVPIFYGFVPTDPAAGYGNGLTLTRLNWYRLVRATVVHEMKHLLAYGRRTALGLPLEEAWLEEGTAMIAEELYARRVFGYGARANISFRASLFCERRPGSSNFPECRDKPLVMLNHFTLLARHLAAIESSSLFGPAEPGDVTFYGAAWAFLRWVLDHHAPDEAAFLRLLTESAEPGTTNVASLAQRPFDELFAEWVLSLALDDRPDVTPESRLTLPSWHLRDIYAGLRQELPLVFPRAYPLVPRQTGAGGFDIRTTGVPAGGAVLIRVDGVSASRQLLDATAAGAGTRLHLVRIH